MSVRKRVVPAKGASGNPVPISSSNRSHTRRESGDTQCGSPFYTVSKQPPQQHAKDLGLNGAANGGEDALRMMIAKRQEKRAQESDNFLDALAAKYAKPEKKAKKGSKK